MKLVVCVAIVLGVAISGLAQNDSGSNDLNIASATTAPGTNFININRLSVTSNLTVASGTSFTASSIVFDGGLTVDAGSSTGSCVFDCTGAPVLQTPASAIFINSTNQNFAWESITGSSDYTLHLYLGATPAGTFASGGSTSTSGTFPSTDGTYFWTVDWTDGVYTSVESPQRKIILDITPPTQPTISVDVTTTSGTFTISWTASTDSLSGLSGYEYSTDGGSTWNTVPGGTGATSVTLTLPAGTYDVMIRSVDAAGNSNPSSSITVTVSAPVILYANPRGLAPGSTTDVEIVGMAFDLGTNPNAVSFSPFSSTPNAASFSFTGAGSTLINSVVGPSVPTGQVGAMDISVMNQNGSSTGAPSICAYSDPFAGSLSIGLRAGDTIEAYQMISMPVYDNPSNFFAAVQNAMGPYDVTLYRLWRYNSISTAYEELPDGIESTQLLDLAGYSFWLISRNGGTIPVGQGLSTKENAFVYVPLKPGWNQIANPYSGDVVWGNVRVGQNLNVAPTVAALTPNPSTDPIFQNAFFWDGSGSYVQVTPADAMVPTLGYWVFNGTNEVQVLYFPKPSVLNGKPSTNVSYSSPSSGSLKPPAPPGTSGGKHLASSGGGGGGGCFVNKPAETNGSGFSAGIPLGIVLILGILLGHKILRKQEN